jgi:hypothetical protein
VPSTISLSLREARSFILERQLLNSVAGANSPLEIIERLGYIQIDTISVVERSHHHILWTRFPGYEKTMLECLLTENRDIFEYWSHAASFLPMKDYQYSLLRKARYKKKYKPWHDSNKRIISYITDRIKSEGPLSSRDFEGNRSGNSGWWNHKPAKAALEYLFHCGDLMVSSRKNFTKLFDLQERVLPPDVNTSMPAEQEFMKHLIVRSVSSHGVISDEEILYLRGKRNSIFETAMNELLEDETIMNVRLEGHEDKVYHSPGSSADIGLQKFNDDIRILSPFDNLLIQRHRLRKLFDFSYTLECYVPKHKRKFGYYCLPVLKGDTFIGVIDCKAYRESGVLELISAYPISGSKRSFIMTIRKELHKLASFAGCHELDIKRAGKQSAQP